MTKRAKARRTKKDLKIAAKAGRSIIQLPLYASNLFVPRRYKILYGGRGGARSWSVARALLIRAAQKKTRILCTREIQSSLKDSVHQLLRDQIDSLELPGFIVTDREIRHRNGSLFLFEGLHRNITKIKSLEGIDICWVEEAERISSRSWQVLIPTIRKSGSEIWVTFNPDQESDATYQRFVVRPPKDCWSKKVNWRDNPWLSPELKDEKDYAYETDPDAADHVWEGNLREISDAQILNGKWKVQEFTVPFIIDRNGDKEYLWDGPYQGIDFGFGSDPFTAVRCWVYDKILYVEHEVYRHHLDLDDTPDEITGTIDHFEDYVTRADSARPDSISHLRQHGIHRIIGAKKGPGSVEDGIAHLRSYRQIIVHSRCVHVVAECKAYSYKVDKNSEDVLPIIVDKHNHTIDAIRYALEPLIKPRRRYGLLFFDGRHQMVCPTCESLLPDNGRCPHCGTLVDVTTGAVLEEAEDVHPAEIVAVEVGAGNGNGHKNGNGNGNGTSHSPPPARLRMRDLNA